MAKKKVQFAIDLTREQQDAVTKIRQHVVTSVRGVAGTGKSTVALSYALQELLTDKTKSLFIAKPPVEAIFNLGFLPGSVEDKTLIYHKVIFDIITHLFMGDGKDLNGKAKQLEKLKERIKVYDISFLRGITFPPGSIVILDEAQNMPKKGLELLIGRLSYDSKIILTGDENQIDIKAGASGLMPFVDATVIIDGAADVMLVENHRNPVALEIVEYLSNLK